MTSQKAFEIRERVIDAPEVTQGLLAIDTALGTSVAFGIAGTVHEAASDDPLRHAEVIGVLIERVFALAGGAPDAVEGVVFGVGPGPFTGLRVGIAAAHAFARGRGATTLPLQGHEAVALSVLETEPPRRIRVVQDARRRELFVTGYAGIDDVGIPVRERDAHLISRADYEEAPGDVWPSRIPAADLVRLAARRSTAGREFEPDRARYLREPDVRTPSAPKRVVP